MATVTTTQSFTGLILERAKTASYAEIGIWIFAGLWLITFLTSEDSPRVKGAPIVGKSFAWEPSVFQRLRFTTKSRHILQDAYDKVNRYSLYLLTVAH